ncbi:multidrug efflux RND transporter permease subunit [Methyloceanibacter sp.]|uniref:efflux RND transporter permease subunit n=1 Tax=Methyloceanibacter sp. TaxID=1965321 RepID=UPI002D2F8E5D|nr:multidrug efflux RND transporter permease subunit [Methyloceanibacter sp.]HZP09849.1 multidrug efflux RND transporter permease subunit [Methyloceanibacter sp.]
MNLSHFFIDRPIFAAVISIIITLVGAVAYFSLPVAQYPEIAPPSISVSASYPGASAEIVAKTVATPLEQEVNGVDNMLYMTSQSTSDGAMSLAVTFKLGTNLDTAQVLVQNRVSTALPRLPEEVRNIGVTVTKQSPDLMMVIHLSSPDGSRDLLYISNYATLHVKDVLARIDGVGNVTIFGARDYSMRIWLDPEKLAVRNLTAGDVVAALRGQNVQVAAGVINQPPVPQPGAFQLNVETQGRLTTPEQFGNIIIKSDPNGRVVRVRDVARVELGAADYNRSGYLDENVAIPLGIFQRPGSNALATAKLVQQAMADLSRSFPSGLRYDIVYNPTVFIQQSVDAVIQTMFEAVVLVVVVIILFLQTWRASVIPIVAIPVSLIGTFAMLAALGFSLNNLSLFGLVLAIGIVVDDAIVVVENVERNIREGLSPRDAAYRTMEEVGGALIAIALVLSAVFIPSTFLTGILGQFFRQFAVTIATATGISLLVSLTLSPALCALLFKPHEAHPKQRNILVRPVIAFFNGFNRAFEWTASRYGALTARLVRVAGIMVVIYAGLIGITIYEFSRAPTGFIPQQDQGYLINIIQLPPGASLARTDEVARKVTKIVLSTPGIAHAVPIVGLDGATFTTAPNAAVVFTPLDDFKTRAEKGQSAQALIGALNQQFAGIQEAFIISVAPPPVRGIGTTGGFKMEVQDVHGGEPAELEGVATAIMAQANQTPGLAGVFTTFSTKTPKVYADIDRVRAEMLGVNTNDVFTTLEVFLGSQYVNDFNFLGRTYRVTAQADGDFRQDLHAIGNLKTRNAKGEMVPLSSVASFRNITGPYRVEHFNLFPSAAVQGGTQPGYSTGYGLATMEKIAHELLPDGYSFSWTELAFQEKLAGNTAIFVFMASVVFVFLLLAAQYESWSLPLAVILIVPMCLLAAVTGLLLRTMDVNILAQIGFVVLIGLAAKNAILIVEFARQNEEHGEDRFQAATEAARVRLRPILMTSFAFILGVLPLMIATGAGAEMRQSLGTAVFCGMLGVTAFGLIFTPVFYVVVRRFAAKPKAHGSPHAAPAE